MTQYPTQPPTVPGPIGAMQPHRGGIILALGILAIVIGSCGIGLVLGLIAYSMGKKDMLLMDAGRMDPSGKGITQAGYICGIVGAILGGIGLLAVCAYFGIIALAIGAGAASGGAGGGGFSPTILPMLL